MENKITQDQSAELQKQLETTKQELENAREQHVPVPVSPQDKFIETIVDKGGEIIKEYARMSSETQQHQTEKEMEYKREELKAIERFDMRDKLYKGILISVCIVILLLAATFTPKAEMIIPVLTLIIGLLFKSNTLSDFFSWRQRKDQESKGD